MKKILVLSAAIPFVLLIQSCQKEQFINDSGAPEIRYSGNFIDSVQKLYREHAVEFVEDIPAKKYVPLVPVSANSNISFTFYDSTEGKLCNWDMIRDDSFIFSTTALQEFSSMAAQTQGELKLVVSAKYLLNAIKSTLSEHAMNGTDIVFLIDKTGSMNDDLEMLKKGMDELIVMLQEVPNLRLAMSFFGDKNIDGNRWYDFKSFENNLDEARFYLRTIRVSSGGDIPESVYEGLSNTISQNFWRSETKRMIILIGDAPPLQKPFSSYSLDNIIQMAKTAEIDMNLYPILVNNGTRVLEKPIEKPKLISMLYPNPCKDLVKLDLMNDSDHNVSIFNMDGKRIHFEKQSGNHWETNVSDLSNGIYILKVKSDDGNEEALRFLVER